MVSRAPSSWSVLETELPSQRAIGSSSHAPIKGVGNKSDIEGTKRSDRKGPYIISAQKRPQCCNTDSLGTNKTGHHGRFGWDGSRE